MANKCKCNRSIISFQDYPVEEDDSPEGVGNKIGVVKHEPGWRQ